MLEKLMNKVKEYNPNANLDIISKAYKFGDKAHEGQLRNSGEKFFIHPFHVAMILTDLNMDTSTIVAGLLHDVIEDTHVTYEDVVNEFSREIADLVEGVTKLKKLKYKTKQENQAENLRKMVLAMSKDIRVIIVKLSDRLHNMRTLEYMTEEKKKEKALETLEIYSPLAHRLGIYKIKWELEDLSLRFLKEDTYYDLVEKVSFKRRERETYIQDIMDKLGEELEKTNIHNEISGRPKNFYSIYKKMSRGKDFEEIFDLTAIRILVDSIKDCYGVLGIVHTLWKPLPGRFKDFIAMPKPNMYQSLHTTVIGPKGEIFEVQIRTYEMHKTAEYGIAAHWKYKEGSSQRDNFDDKLAWLRQLLEWQKDLQDPKDFMETLKIDFFTDEVFMFTPNGDVIDLPEGSTPIDFAYRIHTDIGNSCVGAKVNGRIVPLNYKLKNGNIVEIITSVNSEPSRDWLDIVKSTRAKSKIRQWFKWKNRDKNVTKGREELEEELNRLGYELNKILKDEWLEEIAERVSINSIEDLYAAIGHGNIKLKQVVTKLRDSYYEKYNIEKDEIQKDEDIIREYAKSSQEDLETKSNDGISVKGADNLKTRLAQCCNPVPGDDIIGYVTTGRGVSIHRKDCSNIKSGIDKNRLLQVEWDSKDEESYNANIRVKALDRSGLIAEISLKINEEGIGLAALNANLNKDSVIIIDMTLKINNREELENIINKIKEVNSVTDVIRVTF